MNFETALNIAKELHQGQVDHCGEPYWKHCERIAVMCQQLPGNTSEQTVYVALFHDVFEDVENGRQRLDEKFDYADKERVFNAIDVLTRREGDKYDDYFNRILSSQNRDALLVKYCDMYDHVSRLPLIEDEATAARLQAKYEGKLSYLEDVLEKLGKLPASPC